MKNALEISNNLTLISPLINMHKKRGIMTLVSNLINFEKSQNYEVLFFVNENGTKSRRQVNKTTKFKKKYNYYIYCRLREKFFSFYQVHMVIDENVTQVLKKCSLKIIK